MKNFKQKIKSYGFWTGLSGAVVMLVGTISKAFGLSLDSKIAEQIVMGICGVLVAVGIVSMPVKTEDKTTKTDDYKDDEKCKQEFLGINSQQSTKPKDEEK